MCPDLFSIDVFKQLFLTENEKEAIRKCFHYKQFKKGDTLIVNGDDVEIMYYVLSGCIRNYFIDKKGKEHTVQFAIYDWWITDLIAFFSKTEAVYNLECLSDAEVFGIRFHDIEKLSIQIPEFNKLYRAKLQASIVGYHRRIIANLSKTAAQRYEEFVERYPDIELNIKNYHLASYLGITTESLSRVRRELSRRR
ncbi:cyclic nucleotide-binding domain-containing protein [Flammeovirga yaeyamensis]|uniref:Cyclic nucleotide-binding domain-containing protein n=1 Tax=Flammeovirga yaeyamensis TaxID=367791 RepID=A0AAX1NAM7_9BACT|nr:Crp/Fnr family transcriptional regulator [Flammeovirga yaeyamensis]MBB3697719.1 CRP-like cAMP-binding protein [Flammeovirga yaeyamensis]NMF35923.1 Crp/Fnr family transcriptional regulator [Flammeovirga yaeyamensis]QWG03127.1 cyclic nucleotide-binding domain-containing protein [Flammeovirga yaeyamensis]